ncbi:FERM domain-containing protein [Aphelenchoides besseyi]|nr:FERM domain-containing protein [Aphelenchoides besseyi]KAI6207485.1 FERM domain-containing protein [Aphelenchoides besseyi]
MTSTANTTSGSSSHLNTTQRSNKSFLRSASSFLQRIESRTSFGKTKKFVVQVHSLSDEETICAEFNEHSRGHEVLDYVCRQLNIAEKSYFGLRFNRADDNNHRYWLDLNKSLHRQLPQKSVLCFRVRFYPSDPGSSHIEEITKYFIFDQLKRDLIHCRLQCTQAENTKLGALILQADRGDYDPNRDHSGYVSQFKLVGRQTLRIEDQIAEAHQGLSGLQSSEAIGEFLNICKDLRTYGTDPASVKFHHSNTDVLIGANYKHILVFAASQVLFEIPWNFINEKIDLNKRTVTIGLKSEYASKLFVPVADDQWLEKVRKKMQVKIQASSSAFAKEVWKNLLAQQAFFNQDSASKVKPRFSRPTIPLLTRGSTFRCPTDRVERELQREHDASTPREEYIPIRYPLKRQQPRDDFELTNVISVPEIRVQSATVNSDSPHENPPGELDDTLPESIDEFYRSSTPIEEESPLTRNSISLPVELTNGTVEKFELPEIIEETEEPIQTSPPSNGTLVTNGHLSNGKQEDKSATTVESQQLTRCSVAQQIAATTIKIVLFTLILVFIVVAGMEFLRQSNPHYLRHYRRRHYEPFRAAFLAYYRRYARHVGFF